MKIMFGLGTNPVQLGRMLWPVVALIVLSGPMAVAEDTVDSSAAVGVGLPDDCLEQLSWLEGRWRGEAFGGICEEVWGPVFGETRIGTFRLVTEGRVDFYEFFFFGRVDGVWTKRLRHFNPDMTGWEDKDEWADFQPLECGEDRVVFEGLRYEKIAEDTVRVVLAMGSDDGTTHDVELIYVRAD